MEVFRCPRCGAIFEGKANRCPRCNVLFKYRRDDFASPYYVLRENKEDDSSKQPQVVEKIVEKAIIPETTKENTYFDGKTIQLLGWSLLGCLVTVFTLGICFPIAYAWVEKWRAKHTVINGFRHKLNASGGKLIGKWVLWMLLFIVTLTIFGLWIPVKLEKWKVAHMVLEFDKPEEEEKKEEEKPQEEPKEEPQPEEPKQLEAPKEEEAKEEAPVEEAK